MSSTIFINQVDKQIEPLSDPDAVVREFHESLPEYKRTPLISLPTIANDLGIGHVLLKDETSRLGLPAFKILGASWATYCAITKRLDLTESSTGAGFGSSARVIPLHKLASHAQAAEFGLYAATDGNHGRAVARMASYIGIKARIFVPSMLDDETKSKIMNEGAEVVVYDGDYDQTVPATKAAAEEHPGGKGVLISDTALKLDDETAKWIVEGYQTMFDEIEEQVIELTGMSTITHVVTPVGVGSLAQAVVTHFERTPRPQKPKIVTVEPKSAACLKASLEAGEMTSVSAGYTICTGMCCGTLSAIGWPVLKVGVKAAAAVEDSDVQTAINELQTCGVDAGPCGAASLAGLRYVLSGEELGFGPKSVVVLLCTEGKRGYQMKN